MGEKEYIVFCDESDKHGAFYSNFYGVVVVGASQYERVTRLLNERKHAWQLRGEIKWGKVTGQYLERYEDVIAAFFDEVKAGTVRVRVMFRQNANVPTGLTEEQLDTTYYRLYYQFIKHHIGLRYVEPSPNGTRVRLYFDQFPDTGEKVASFKVYLLGLNQDRDIRRAGVRIVRDEITEVRSHDHVLLQCLDVVLGSMAFRLNDKHLVKPPGSTRRAKRTIAKEKLYKTILSHIRTIHPRFNIGVSTSIRGNVSRRWTDPYLHWNFVPSSTEYRPDLTKKRIKHRSPT